MRPETLRAELARAEAASAECWAELLGERLPDGRDAAEALGYLLEPADARTVWEALAKIGPEEAPFAVRLMLAGLMRLAEIELRRGLTELEGR